MRRSALVLGMVAAASTVALMGERPASACGGCFRPPSETDADITDERMLLSVSPTQSTLYDQIRYSGNPSSFAWVLPTKGIVDVGLSSDAMFAFVEQSTQVQVIPPPLHCPPPPSNCAFGAEDGLGTGGPAGAHQRRSPATCARSLARCSTAST